MSTAIATTTERRLMTREDLAPIFGRSLDTLRNWERNGTLPKPMRIGRTSYWRPGQISRFLETGVARSGDADRDRSAHADLVPEGMAPG